MKLQIGNIRKDPAWEGEERSASLESMIFSNGGSQMYGTVLIPAGKKDQTYPCVVLLHGFPGFAATFDIAQSLRRTGIVVISFFYRGSWGSQGNYTFSGAVDDTVCVAEWAHREETAAKYHIDRDNIFFVGHSMGGFVSINATRRLPWIRGTAVMSPYDLVYWPLHQDTEPMKQVIDENLYALHIESPAAIYQNIAYCCQEGYGIFQAYEDLKDRNLYFIGATQDDVAPVAKMIEPLWNQLQQHTTNALQAYDILNTNHAYDDKRVTVSELFAKWIEKVLTKTAE